MGFGSQAKDADRRGFKSQIPRVLLKINPGLIITAKAFNAIYNI